MSLHFYAVLAFYNLMMPLAFLVAIPGYIVKMVRRGNYRQDFFQRFGLYSADAKARLAATRPIWINAVSVGELMIAHKLIQALKTKAPEIPIVVSCTTSTGYELAQKQHEQFGYIPFYNPLDLWLPVWSAFRQVAPRQIVLVDGNLWPNFLWEAKRRGIPVSIVNARLSPRSERRYRQFGVLTRPIFEQLDQVLVQLPEDVDRWAGLGVAKGNIHCTGSIKFDEANHTPPTKKIDALSKLLGSLRAGQSGPVIMTGSTHPGEEKLIGEAFLQLRESFPDAFYIAVPRHWERGREVKKDLESLGFKPVLKTDFDSAPETLPEPDPDRCLIVNTTGELRAWYYLSDLVLIGKSFLSIGGQNPIEPLAIGKPILLGPHMENFELLVQALVEAKGCRQLQDLDELLPAMRDLLGHPEATREMVAKGNELLASHQGAAQRSGEAILNCRSPR